MLGGDKEGGPAGRVLEVNTLELETGSVLGVEQNRAQVRVAGIEDLQAGELIPPPLTVAVENSAAVDLDVLAAPFPKHEAVLEWVGKGVFLPVGRIVGELDLALEVDLDVVEEGQIERLSDDEGLALGEVEGATVVGLLETAEEVVGDIVGVGLGGPDGDSLPAMRLAALGCVRVFLLELGERVRDAGGELRGREGRNDGGREGCEGEELHDDDSREGG